jgi:hypothetical protein
MLCPVAVVVDPRMIRLEGLLPTPPSLKRKEVEDPTQYQLTMEKRHAWELKRMQRKCQEETGIWKARCEKLRSKRLRSGNDGKDPLVAKMQKRVEFVNSAMGVLECKQANSVEQIKLAKRDAVIQKQLSDARLAAAEAEISAMGMEIKELKTAGVAECVHEKKLQTQKLLSLFWERQSGALEPLLTSVRERNTELQKKLDTLEQWSYNQILKSDNANEVLTEQNNALTEQNNALDARNIALGKQLVVAQHIPPPQTILQAVESVAADICGMVLDKQPHTIICTRSVF